MTSKMDAKRSSREKFMASEFLANESAEAKEQFWNVSEDTFHWLQGIPSGLTISRDMYLSNEQIRKIFSPPGADTPGSKAWHDAQATLARRRAQKAAGKKEGKERLYAEVCVGSALDAILATVYIDSLRGIETQVCALSDCEEIFEITSQHGKRYCSNYHAYLASVRRSRRKAKQRRNPRIRKGKDQ